MNLKIRVVLPLFVVLSLMISQFSCEHSPTLMMDDDMVPTDSMVTNIPCDMDSVYFDLQILPILTSSCAFSGCHDEDSAQDGVVLTSYERVIETAGIIDSDPLASKFYEALVEVNSSDRMPPAPADPLAQDQIDLIGKWIQQGSFDLHCNPDTIACDVVDVSFSETIQPIINTNCGGCHTGDTPSSGISLNTHADVKITADDGSFLGSVSWSPGFEAMPQGGSQLNQCIIDQIDAWISDGALDN